MIEITPTSSFDFNSPEYQKLLAGSNATAFQHPDWLGPFYEILVPSHGVEPYIVVGRKAGELRLVLPLVRSGSSIDYAFLDVTDYACPVMQPGTLLSQNGLARELLSLVGNGLLTISPVHQEHVADWQVLLGLEPELLPFAAHALPVAVSISGMPQHFSARRRNDLARKAKRLGQLELEVTRGDAIPEVFREAQAFRRGRFANDPLQLDYGLEFYREVASRSDLSLTFRLSHEGRTVAMLFGLIDRKCFRYVILACDYERYADFSPGLLIFDRATTYWAQNGGEMFDFTIGDEPYKEDLGCISTPMFAFSVGK